jgi:hypothetical protein
VALVSTDVSEDLIVSIMRLKRISQLQRLAVTSNSVLILFTLMIEVILSAKLLLLQELHCVAFQKMAFFIVTALETSNLL